jgi:hypothetical protein
VPARDLTDEEVEEFATALKSELEKEDPRRQLPSSELLLKTGLYEHMDQPVRESRKAKE